MFLTAGLCLLGLELLTLLVCIIVFAPLGQTASRAFLLCIALTALALVLTALAAAFLSGFQGDRAAHARQLAQRKQVAAAGGALCAGKRPRAAQTVLRFPKALCLVGCPALLLAGFAVLYVTKGQQGLAVHLLRQGAQALSAAGFLGFAAGLYWANCSGTSLVQRIYLSDGALRYAGYSGMEERVEFSYLLFSWNAFGWAGARCTYRAAFAKTTQDAWLPAKGPAGPRAWVPRTFPQAQEQALLHFLAQQAPQAQQAKKLTGPPPAGARPNTARRFPRGGPHTLS